MARRYLALALLTAVSACASEPGPQVTDNASVPEKPTVENVAACYDAFNTVQQLSSVKLAAGLMKKAEEDRKYPKTNFANDPAHHSLSAFVDVMMGIGGLMGLPDAAAEACRKDPKGGLDAVQQLADQLMRPDDTSSVAPKPNT